MNTSGKSGMLLNSALWGLKYNKNMQTEDPTKKPLILMVSQENTNQETFERIWSHFIGEEVAIATFSPKKAVYELNKAGFVSDNFKNVYKPNRSIDTSDLDAYIDELATEGYEVKMLIHDYIKRIKSIEHFNDNKYQEYGKL